MNRADLVEALNKRGVVYGSDGRHAFVYAKERPAPFFDPQALAVIEFRDCSEWSIRQERDARVRLQSHFGMLDR